jgi:hypothetical protein
MSCRHRLPDIIDLARGETVALEQEKMALDHVRSCEKCAARLEQERAMSAALRRLAAEPQAPASEIDGALLAAFDAARTSRGPASAVAAWLPLAAIVAATVMIVLVPARGRTTRQQPLDVREAPAAGVSSAAVSPLPAPQPAVITRARGQRRASSSLARLPAAAPEATPFIVPAGASAWPRFESGELIRIDIPDSMLPALGLWPRPSEAGALQADVLVGQDGLARAVRLVQ